ncbi:hypothetical protein Y032_0054g2452 [Ancylostoma ceylanicum]|uniref:Uncharacterized protein n=1 Tax=Ancylostoma ceylanicum TaxID=53326 RepID=A0A016U633_9BILA|nr:hypothetical protein Y032_0054g2452 [Ancylostoma ceylanicum]
MNDVANDLRRAADEPSQCFILPDSSGTNLPTPEGWMACLATGAIEPSTKCVRSEPLTTAPRQPLTTRPNRTDIHTNYDTSMEVDSAFDAS